MSQHTDIFIFDVGLGQSIFVYPRSAPNYGMLIDCGHNGDFHPIDFLLQKNFISNKILSNLTITNYDQDHFSGIDELRKKVGIQTVRLAKNLSSHEIKQLKDEITVQLDHVCSLKDTYTSPANYHMPPYEVRAFHLEKHHLDTYDTNNLSQVIFLKQHGTVVCISGDMEEKGWLAMLNTHPEIKEWIKSTKVFIASHHGRSNGFCSDVFSLCRPECIIISDKGIIHDTQKDMASVYGKCVADPGINMNNRNRKVLTTRDDGHLWLQLHPGAIRTYANFWHA